MIPPTQDKITAFYASSYDDNTERSRKALAAPDDQVLSLSESDAEDLESVNTHKAAGPDGIPLLRLQNACQPAGGRLYGRLQRALVYRCVKKTTAISLPKTKIGGEATLFHAVRGVSPWLRDVTLASGFHLVGVTRKEKGVQCTIDGRKTEREQRDTAAQNALAVSLWSLISFDYRVGICRRRRVSVHPSVRRPVESGPVQNAQPVQPVHSKPAQTKPVTFLPLRLEARHTFVSRCHRPVSCRTASGTGVQAESVSGKADSVSLSSQNEEGGCEENEGKC
ncbi:hypothetical protein DPEC_G00322720 [Dallia pectoralis]|uniref:Uncharacterized protein n=1 Tax=Dallia pectoralis TaxID=75939 RepID=A0ACC2FAH1_DALPE|nr:hypothetical protein DPEC_G00322720 [Dallia pectoralis]